MEAYHVRAGLQCIMPVSCSMAGIVSSCKMWMLPFSVCLIVQFISSVAFSKCLIL